MESEIWGGRGGRRIQSVRCGHACSTLIEAFTAIHCNICDCWHSSLHLIIFPKYMCPLLTEDKLGQNDITLLPSHYSFGFHLSVCLSPAHPACKRWCCVFSLFTQQRADTSAFLDPLPIY